MYCTYVGKNLNKFSETLIGISAKCVKGTLCIFYIVKAMTKTSYIYEIQKLKFILFLVFMSILIILTTYIVYLVVIKIQTYRKFQCPVTGIERQDRYKDQSSAGVYYKIFWTPVT